MGTISIPCDYPSVGLRFDATSNWEGVGEKAARAFPAAVEDWKGKKLLGLEKMGGIADEIIKASQIPSGSETMATLEKTDANGSRWAGLGLLLFVLTGLSFGALLAVLSAS